MKKLYNIIWLTIGASVLFASCQKGRMREELHRIDSLNVANAMLDTISGIDEVVDYFDRHGTANERMLAHYLQGRVAADRNDAPRALRHFYDAVTCADTASDDCNFAKLSRIYGQVARLYHHQRMAKSEIEAYGKAIYYAEKAHDTLNVAKFTEHLADGYYYQNQMDSVLYYKQRAMAYYDMLGKDDLKTAAMGLVFFAYVNQENYAEAKKAMDEVEKSRLLFKSDGQVKEGMEIYYYFVGKYYEHAGQLDLAESFYRKIQHSMSADSTEASSSGLFSVYYKKRDIDSVYKYAQQYVQAVDTASYRHAADEMVRMQSLYSYEHSERMAAKKEKEAYQYQLYLTMAIVGIALLVGSGGILYRRQRRRQRQRIMAQNSKYSLLLSKYDGIQSELTQLQLNANDYKKRKESEIDLLRGQLNEYISAEMIAKRWTTEADIIKAPIVSRLHDLASRAKQPTAEEWAELQKHISVSLPSFVNSLHPHELTYQELRVCMLIRLQFVHTEITSLMGVSKQRVTNLRTHINLMVFGEKGSPSLDHNLMQL